MAGTGVRYQRLGDGDSSGEVEVRADAEAEDVGGSSATDPSSLLIQSGARGGETESPTAYRRNLAAFFLLGLANNFSYVVFLSAAEDILDRVAPNQGTGIVLLADIIPTLIVKATAPFYMQRIAYGVRIGVAVAAAVLSLVMVAFATNATTALAGICFASFSSGIGEITFLALTARYSQDTVHSWGSGTGAAGITGSVAYLGLTFLMSPKDALLLMIIVPLSMGACYWGLLTAPTTGVVKDNPGYIRKDTFTLQQKLRMIPPLLKYMLPLYFVYFAEYLINQGLYEHLKWGHIFINPKTQYRVYQSIYQIGVFISRSTGSCFKVRRLWIPAALQCLNLVVLSLDTKFQWFPWFWIIWVFILYEGLLGGSTYVNAFSAIREDVDEDKREFSLGAASVADTCGISSAGIVALGYTVVFRHTAPR